MSLQPIRFLHTSDWHLEIPVGGVDHVPTGLRDAFVEAPFQAAERVVQAALDERVDFLLLTGNALSVESACPYSFEFLLRQFQRLGDQGIHVYWLGGELDDLDLWPAQLDLPKTVHTFPVGTLQQIDHRRDKKVVASILGQSWRRDSTWRAGDYTGSEDAVPRIAACFGSAQKRSLENKGIRYWALGGRDQHKILVDANTTAVYAGSPQGRRPSDTAAHGAVLVELSHGDVTTRLIETDVWRWQKETINAGKSETLEQLQSRLVQQVKQTKPTSSTCGSLLLWTIACRGSLATQLQSTHASERLLRAIQAVTENDSRWSLAIETEPAEIPAELAEEDTILGDFLRSVQRYEGDSNAWQDLLPYLPEDDSREALTGLLREGSDESRQLLWRRVAAWGADLLQGNTTVTMDKS